MFRCDSLLGFDFANVAPLVQAKETKKLPRYVNCEHLQV